jgi:hypothetical protein
MQAISKWRILGEYCGVVKTVAEHKLDAVFGDRPPNLNFLAWDKTLELPAAPGHVDDTDLTSEGLDLGLVIDAKRNENPLAFIRDTERARQNANVRAVRRSRSRGAPCPSSNTWL